MKKVLGLDLGTTSIGWAFIQEADSDTEKSKIIRTGVRIVPLSSDEENNYEKGQSITLNAERTEKRQARRNKFRYKLRRDQLIEELKNINFIDDNSKLTETGSGSTHETHRLRAKAVNEQINREEIARVLLAINKKRGYKSSRKANKVEEGSIIDEMQVAKHLYKNNLTPAEYSIQLINGDKAVPQFYRTDLEQERKTIWDVQSEYYPEALSQENFNLIENENKTNTANFFEKKLNIKRVELNGNRQEKALQTYQLRSIALREQLNLEEIAHIITELNNEINQASGYLSEISDRSKELYFNDETVGQYQYKLLKQNKHNSLTNRVFYRKDYENEFDAIWKEQAIHYPELTDNLKSKIRDRIIFYQRRLRSQKGLIKICEFEGKERIVTLKNGRKKKKLIGPRAVPKSSPVFQEFRIWQNINNIIIKRKDNPNKKWEMDEETKMELFKELNWQGKKTENQFLTWLFKGSDEDKKEWTTNFSNLMFNITNSQLLDAYKIILELSGHDNISFSQDVDKMIEEINSVFENLGIRTDLFEFDTQVPGNDFDKQPYYQLWHLLYSYESDQSKTGIESLIEKLEKNFGFEKEYARVLAGITFEQDYGNLSARAIKKIMPHLQDGCEYSEACSRAGYRHSGYLSKEENLARELDDKIDILKKNSLRNPVVEKILNQMIHVVNDIISDEDMGRPDEIRIELARDLKQTKEQRKKATSYINKATKRNNNLREELYNKIGLDYISRNDLIKYRLYKELEPLGHKTLYTKTYIELSDLFTTNKFDVEHILPQAKIYDDSFTNKTLETREANIDKGNKTAIDYVKEKYGEEGVQQYKRRINELIDASSINYNKKKKLLTTKENIPEGFLNRDIGNTAFISRKAMELLHKVCYSLVPTAGKITNQLREDWGLIQVLQELNWNKYEKQGLTYFVENKNGKRLPRIKDWTKRNDHRHHAMDAIAIAFTKRQYIQYLNNLKARSNKGGEIYGIQQNYTFRDRYGNRRFKKPYNRIREDAKFHLECILVSFKAKNKVTTKNINRINVEGKGKYKIQEIQTPRGQLHKETIYGRSKTYVTKDERVGSKFIEDKINTVANKHERNALMKRFKKHGCKPKKAFLGKNSLKKNPLYTVNGERVPQRVKTVTFKNQFTIRKDVDPGLNVKKVVDVGIRKILEARIQEFNGDKKKAFSNLDTNPIWQNKKHGIAIKRVTITGISNGDPIHYKKDHNGELILDDEGEKIPVDYVQTGNNHHVAIYKDENGDLHEEVVSFFEAVERKKQGMEVVQQRNEDGMSLAFTLKQNEMFVFPGDDFKPFEIDLMDPNSKSIISKNLFRVQKISSKEYVFNHHYETEAVSTEIRDNKKMLRGITHHYLHSESHLKGIRKVRLNHLGDIVEVGEY